jgi:hypothetical protein
MNRRDCAYNGDDGRHDSVDREGIWIIDQQGGIQIEEKLTDIQGNVEDES